MTASPHDNRPNLRGLTILIVDHDADSVEALAMYLRSCRAGILTAHSAAAAMVYIDGAPILDAVVTGVLMPGESGVEFVRAIRRHHSAARRSVPVIALTVLDDTEVRMEEFDAYLRKPVDPEELCRVIQAAIQAAIQRVTTPKSLRDRPVGER